MPFPIVDRWVRGARGRIAGHIVVVSLEILWKHSAW